ncbi:UNVERIFIED_CONTAM: hypothetical protein FKN15_076479 [Acipenser sinensis]
MDNQHRNQKMKIKKKSGHKDSFWSNGKPRYSVKSLWSKSGTVRQKAKCM